MPQQAWKGSPCCHCSERLSPFPQGPAPEAHSSCPGPLLPPVPSQPRWLASALSGLLQRDNWLVSQACSLHILQVLNSLSEQLGDHMGLYGEGVQSPLALSLTPAKIAGDTPTSNATLAPLPMHSDPRRASSQSPAHMPA